jgi:hypothetical protein
MSQPMQNLFALITISGALIFPSSAALSQAPRSVTQDRIDSCLNWAIQRKTYEKTQLTGNRGYGLTFRCSSLDGRKRFNSATRLYNHLKDLGLKEEDITFREGAKAKKIEFGDSACHLRLTERDGSKAPRNDHFCRFSLDVGSKVMEAW